MLRRASQRAAEPVRLARRWLASGRLKLPHEILGVGPNAERSEIKQAYAAHAKLLHPDSASSTSTQDVEKFATITKAYKYLINPKRGWDGDAAADGVREPPPPPGEEDASGPDWGGYFWAAEFYGLGKETEFESTQAGTQTGKKAKPGRARKT